jgi:peroxiredoxin
MPTKRSSSRDGTPRSTRSPERPRGDASSSSAHRKALLAPGTKAPAFTLHSTPDQTVSLSDFRGQPVILAFYPADWSPVCGDQLTLYNEILPEFQRHHAELMGISVDGVWCHAAFARDRHLHFPLLSDFEPKGAVARAYGAYDTTGGLSNRALFALDGNGVIRWSYLSPMGVNPGADGILAALESMEASGSRAVKSTSTLIERRPAASRLADGGTRRPPVQERTR